MVQTAPRLNIQPKWILKGCPRCHGDLYVEQYFKDEHVYENCLQCGYQRDLTPTKSQLKNKPKQPELGI